MRDFKSILIFGGLGFIGSEYILKARKRFPDAKIINFDSQNNIGMPLNWKADISKLKKLGFTKSVEIKQGVKEYINWFNLECLP